MTRRGITLSVGLLAGMSAEEVGSAAVPLGLQQSTAKAALLMAADQSRAGGMISARVAGLMKGVLNTMAMTKLSLAALALVTVSVVVTGTGAMAYYLLATEPDGPQQTAPSQTATTKEDKSKDALAEFKKVYALEPGEDLKWVPPPFPDSRTDYIRSLYGAKAGDSLPEFGSMYLRWQGGSFHWLGANSSGGSSLQRLPQMLASIYPQEIEGSQALLETVIEGDFIIRKGLSAQKFVERLEPILRNRCGLAVKLSLREEERKVFVARGKYKHALIDGRPEQLEIYGRLLTDPNMGGGGTDDFPAMLQHVGAWVGRRIINEVKEVPKKVSWHYNFRSPFTDQQHQEDTNADAVLGRLAEQTGLTFDEQDRKVRVLFVENSPIHP